LKITITITGQISECSNTWDEFLPAGHFLKSRHMQSFEDAVTKDVENNYLHVFLKGKLIGLLYLQQFRLRHQHLNLPTPSTFLSKTTAAAGRIAPIDLW
jgi:hypothetical protein